VGLLCCFRLRVITLKKQVFLETNRVQGKHFLFCNDFSRGLSHCQFEVSSYSGCLNEMSSHGKSGYFLHSQVPCTGNNNQSMASHIHPMKTIALNEGCSNLFSHGLTDPASVAIGNFRNEVDCQDLSSEKELRPFSYTGLLNKMSSHGKSDYLLHSKKFLSD